MSASSPPSEGGGGSQIAGWYAGRSVLITGATGFMGKVLVEKLLRSCPAIQCIYVLLRAKKGRGPDDRLKEMTDVPIFDSLRSHTPHALTKVVAISGDITEPNLGISVDDENLLKERVSVVFHSAATVKFDEKLKLSVEMNVLGVKRIIELCKKMKHLEALVHVSTAYCNCDQTEVLEKVYPPPGDLDQLQRAMDVLPDDVIDEMTRKLIGNRPNTYTFTKAMAEHVLSELSGDLPVAIVRPSIVTAAWKEPLVGWVDNLNGPTGLFAGAGKGVLRSLLCHRDLVADLIPVDVCINLLISVAWRTATQRPQSLTVYNCTTSTSNPIRWGDVESIGHKYLLKYPFSGCLWYPGGSFKRSRSAHTACTWTFHYIPAVLCDALSMAAGRKPIMMHIQNKLHKALTCLEFFTTREWRFPNDNVQKLWASIEPADQDTFPFDITNMDWDNYLENYVVGTRRYIMKEDDNTLTVARKQLNRMLWLDRMTKLVLLSAIWRMALSQNHNAVRLSGSFIKIVKSLQQRVTNIVIQK